MQTAERVACLFWLALSALVGAGSYRLGLGTPQQPESGFLPFWTAVLLAFLAVVHFIRLLTLKYDSDALSGLRWGEHWRRVVVLVLALAVYAIALSTFGYMLDTFLLMTALFSLYKRQAWWKVLGASLLVIGVTHLIFSFALNIQLPKGLLGIG